MLYSADFRQQTQIVKVGVNFAYISEQACIELVDQVLVFINADETRALDPITPKRVLKENDGVIQAVYLNEQLIEFALGHICDDDGKLSATKVSMFLGKALLVKNGELPLNEFTALHRSLLQEKVPFDLL